MHDIDSVVCKAQIKLLNITQVSAKDSYHAKRRDYLHFQYFVSTCILFGPKEKGSFQVRNTKPILSFVLSCRHSRPQCIYTHIL